MTAGNGLVQDHAQTPQIERGLRSQTGQRFRRQIERGSYQLLCERQARRWMQSPGQFFDETGVGWQRGSRRSTVPRPIEDRGKAEVEQLRHAFGCVADV